MPQRGGMRHYSNQQMIQGGNLATFSESISGNNSNSQLLVTPQINQMPPPSHQGPPPHQSQVSVIVKKLKSTRHASILYLFFLRCECIITHR